MVAVPPLGDQHDILAVSHEGLADDLLRATVSVGGVHEVDPGVERPVQDAGQVGRVGVANCAKDIRGYWE